MEFLSFIILFFKLIFNHFFILTFNFLFNFFFFPFLLNPSLFAIKMNQWVAHRSYYFHLHLLILNLIFNHLYFIFDSHYSNLFNTTILVSFIAIKSFNKKVVYNQESVIHFIVYQAIYNIYQCFLINIVQIMNYLFYSS
mgnify:CR=1 FL=1